MHIIMYIFIHFIIILLFPPQKVAWALIFFVVVVVEDPFGTEKISKSASVFWRLLILKYCYLEWK